MSRWVQAIEERVAAITGLAVCNPNDDVMIAYTAQWEEADDADRERRLIQMLRDKSVTPVGESDWLV